VIGERFPCRPFEDEDIGAAVELIRDVDAAFLDEVTDEADEQDMRDWLDGYDLAHDTKAVRERATGALAAIGMIEKRGDLLELDGYVRPDFTGHGIGSGLVEWAEEEARRRGLVEVRSAYLTRDEDADRLFRDRGYEYVRSFYRMVIDLDAPPPAPEWPAGCAVSRRAPGDERLFWEVLEGAFAHHWGHVERPLDEWTTRVERDSDDPALWFLVRAGDEPAAAAICAPRYGLGWISRVGVLPAYRRRGLGRALLLLCFGELFERGQRRMGLGVDATNETGAIALYEGVGMRVAWQADFRQRSLGG
jgi:GNAT superfamily N-acetyltransferase